MIKVYLTGQARQGQEDEVVGNAEVTECVKNHDAHDTIDYAISGPKEDVVKSLMKFGVWELTKIKMTEDEMSEYVDTLFEMQREGDEEE